MATFSQDTPLALKVLVYLGYCQQPALNMPNTTPTSYCVEGWISLIAMSIPKYCPGGVSSFERLCWVVWSSKTHL